jgi:uncharacterized phiE125 gp8 family phage protein
MGLTTVTGPAFEPLTLDEALAHCRIDQDTEDGLIAGYIMAARQYAERSLRSPIIKATFDFTLDWFWPFVAVEWMAIPAGYPRIRIELPYSSVREVTSVKYVAGDGTTQTLDPILYFTVLDASVPYIDPAYGVSWPTPRYQPNCITVRFDAGLAEDLSELSAGYETVRQAMLLLVAYWYDNRGSAQFGARGRAGADTGTVSSSVMPAEIPPGVDALLSFDRRVRIA